MDEFRLGDWTVHPSQDRISREDEVVHLQPRIMDVLVYLSGHPGKVLSKEELIDGVWPDEFVANSVLTRAVAVLRRSLGDDAKSPRYLETIPKRGYRLVAEVEDLAASPTGSGSEGGTSPPDPSAAAPSELHRLGRDVRWFLEWGERELLLRKGEHIIGRGLEAQIAILEPGISRQHARLTVTESEATIEDLGSKNGTKIQGERIQGRVQLVNGDQIVLGPALLVFRDIASLSTRSHYADVSAPDQDE